MSRIGVIHIQDPDRNEKYYDHSLGHNIFVPFTYCGATWGNGMRRKDSMYSYGKKLEEFIEEGKPVCEECLGTHKFGLDLLRDI